MISLNLITAFFGWMTIINFVFLLFTTIAIVAARSTVARIHGGMFGLESADLSHAYFQYLAQYKIATIIFSLTPYIALKLIA